LRPPGQADSVSKAMEAAYRTLAIRSRSEEELKKKLRQKGFRESLIDQAVSSLREKGYLNDAEFSLDFAQHLLRTRHYGVIRIVEELRKKGIPAGIIRDTINSLKGEVDEKAMVINVLEARLRGSDYIRMDEKGKRRIIQYLSRKGFHLNIIYEVLKSRNWDGIEEDIRE
jgi:regulatory protein